MPLTAFLTVVLMLSVCDRKPGANGAGSCVPDEEVTVYVSTVIVLMPLIVFSWFARDRK
ncbi:MAG TPA: hypothetical protein VLR92_00255 [Blastocatellia bacterium]|nr:hypothetical protein [Blastocatellia bacterium]